MKEKSHKSGNSKRVTRRFEHKSERQATRAVLRGDHGKQPLSARWNFKPEPIILTDDAKVVAPRGKSKGKSKRCKRNKNGPHVVIYKGDHANWWKNGYFCEKCGKHLWNHKPTREEVLRDPMGEHWLSSNILARLAGNPCSCRACLDKTMDS